MLKWKIETDLVHRPINVRDSNQGIITPIHIDVAENEHCMDLVRKFVDIHNGFADIDIKFKKEMKDIDKKYDKKMKDIDIEFNEKTKALK